MKRNMIVSMLIALCSLWGIAAYGAEMPGYEFRSTSAMYPVNPSARSTTAPISSAAFSSTATVKVSSSTGGNTGGGVVGTVSSTRGVSAASLNSGAAMVSMPALRLHRANTEAIARQSDAESQTTARRAPGTPTDEDEEEAEKQPIGDGLPALLVLACVYALCATYKVSRKRNNQDPRALGH